MTAKWSHSKGIGPHRYLEAHQRPRGIHAIFEDFWPLWPSFWPLLVKNRPTPLHIFRFLTPKIAILGLCRLEQSSKGCTWPSFGVDQTSITQILTKLQYFEVRVPKRRFSGNFRNFCKICQICPKLAYFVTIKNGFSQQIGHIRTYKPPVYDR